MALEKVVDIIVSREANVKFSVNGAEGKECVALSEPFENAFGPVVQERQYKPEFYTQGESAQIEHKQGDGE